MGNRLAVNAPVKEPKGPSPKCVEFFKRVRIKWLDFFLAELKARIGRKPSDEFDLEDKTEVLSWKNYFLIFSQVQDKVDIEMTEEERSTWHTATLGFTMKRDFSDPQFASIPPPPPPGLPDGFTDDDPSDLSDSESEDGGGGENKVKQSPKRKKQVRSADLRAKYDASVAGYAALAPRFKEIPEGWDAAVLSPIFFGFEIQREADVKAKAAQALIDVRDCEQRAIERALKSRSSAISEVEAANKSREAIRVKKIEEVEALHIKNRSAKEAELAQSQTTLPPDAFQLFKRQWDSDYAAALDAFEIEMDTLKNVNYLKTMADRRNLQRKIEDLDAFKDVESQEMPSAERLEQISRVELHFWMDEIDKKTRALELAKHEYGEVKAEVLTDLIGENKKKAAEAKTLLNFSEAAVKSKQKDLRVVIEALTDAETLLSRAIRMKKQQDRLLPLFQLLSGETMPSCCRFNIFFAAISLLVIGTFDTKIDAMLNMVDTRKRGSVSISDLLSTLLLYNDAMYRLRLMSMPPNEDDLRNVLFRSFMERGLTLDDRLTYYEAKQIIRNMCAHSRPASIALGVPRSDELCTYQRFAMAPLRLLTLDLIGPAACKYRHHYEASRYRSQLEPSRVQRLHELALAMGESDPNRPDYSRYVKTKQAKKRSLVDPLSHGHLNNCDYIRMNKEKFAAVRLQAMFRAHRDRRVAEIAAKKQAFEEAKLFAIKEMKKVITDEFRTRESSSGVGKLKWDAQVRMKQAKLRVGGQNVNREDTVLLMMEEAINFGIEEIDTRFKQIAITEGFSDTVFIPPPRQEQESQDLFSIMGLVRKPAVLDSDAVLGDIATPRPDEDGKEDDANQEEAGRKNSVASKKNIDVSSSLIGITEERTALILRGQHQISPADKGETLMERELRLMMASPASSLEQLTNRIRSLDNAFSEMRIFEMLTELPSKRLLLKFAMTLPLKHLAFQLSAHFSIPRNVEQIAQIMKNLVKTDTELGIFMSRLQDIQDRCDLFVKRLEESALVNRLPDLELRVRSRFKASVGASELDIIEDEGVKIEDNLIRFRTIAQEALEGSQRLQEKFKKSVVSILEMEQRRKTVQMLISKIAGTPFEFDISLESRQSWMKRLNTAFNAVETSKAETEAKYSEIKLVGKEFIEFAVHDAQIIVNEYFLPKYRKTIQVHYETAVDGRPKYCGRGIDGRSQVFEAHNIAYRVLTDDHGIFNGSDEHAAKAGSNDRIGSIEYLKTHTKRLNVPLIATVDYFGFRVLAVSKLQCEEMSFTDEGDLRKVKEDFVHGVIDKGQMFVNKSKTASALLKAAASKLNLMEHELRGFKDVVSSRTSCSAEIKVYRTSDDQYYACDFWLAMPAEHPDYTPHLPIVPRRQSVFWRLLRPELLKFLKQPLSPNAFNELTESSKDHVQQLEGLAKATEYLVQEVIPIYLNSLSRRDLVLPLSQGFGIDIASELHCRGINIRHLGYMRSSLYRTLPGFVKLFFNENFLRTSRDLRDEVKNGDILKVAGAVYTVKETPQNPFTHSKIPISQTYLDEDVERVQCVSGSSFMSTEKNSEQLRALFLAEMVARAIKQIIRFMLRSYARKINGTSPDFLCTLYCEYFNIITGAHPKSSVILQEDVFEAIRERFGPSSVRSSERDNLQVALQPSIVYIIKRLQKMLGVQLNVAAIGEFNSRPIGFSFCSVDFLECASVVRHNLPFIFMADGVLVSLRAEEAEKMVYEVQVRMDSPTLYFPLNDRKGTRVLINKGSVPSYEVDGKLGVGCILERSGPIVFDKLSRSILFEPESKSRIDTKYHPLVVSPRLNDKFSVELYLKCTGGLGVRCAVMCGRFGIQVNRDDEWIFIFVEGIHELAIRIAPMVVNEWVHFVCTFDGTTVRAYKNSVLVSTLEVEGPLQLKRADREAERDGKKEILLAEEHTEREEQKALSLEQAEKYFKTREGLAELKRAMQVIMESFEFQRKNIGAEEKDHSSAARAKKTEALKQAKQDYTTELYIKNVHEVAVKFTALREEVDDELKRDIAQGEIRSQRGLRVGASCATSMPSNFFQGYVSHLSVYNTCLTPDRVLAHFLAGSMDRTQDAQRLYAVASARFEDALQFATDDPMILKNFAFSLCNLLQIELTATTAMGVSRGKIKVLEAIAMFKNLMLADGIAQILLALPREVEFANIVVDGVRAIFEVDRLYFSRNKSMSRQDLVNLPVVYALDGPENPRSYTEAAAMIYQEVSRDPTLVKCYGEGDISFLSRIKTPELVNALIKCNREDGSLNVVNVGEIFRHCISEFTSIPVSDDDVDALTEGLPLSIGFDLAFCKNLTNTAAVHISRLENVRIVSFEGCPGLTDGFLDPIADYNYITLEALNIAGNQNLTDLSLKKIVSKCKGITSLNVSGCPLISHDILTEFLQMNKKMSFLKAAYCYITDAGLCQMINFMSTKYMTCLDLSFCRDISDFGILSLAEKCTSLATVSLAGLNRVTDDGARRLCANCWNLKSLSLEDIFLLNDSAFWFDRAGDGRPLADEKMLTSLTTLNLRDCINITDGALRGLSERCRQLETLSLRGCEKLTSDGLRVMTDLVQFKVGLCDSLKVLDLAYCSAVSSEGILDLLSACGCLEDLNLDGLLCVSDELMQQVCMMCRTITKLSLQRCHSVTDATICSIVDYLWVERLDVSHCTRLTDAGIEVLALGCSAVQVLHIRRCTKITRNALFALTRSCRDLRELDLRDCPLIDDDDVSDMKKFHTLPVKITRK